MFSRFGTLSALAVLFLAAPAEPAPGAARAPADPVVVPLQTPPPLPGSPPTGAAGIRIDPQGAFAFVANHDGLELLRVSTSSGQVVGSYRSVTPITGVQNSPDFGLLAVLSRSGSTVTLLNASDLTVRATVVTAPGPCKACFSSDGSLLYVACGVGRSVQVFETGAGTLQRATATEDMPADLALTLDGSSLAVAFSDADRLRVLGPESLETRTSVSIPAGTTGLCVLPTDGGASSILLASSAICDTLTVVDPVRWEVLKIVTSKDPVEVGPAGAVAGMALVGRDGGKLETLMCDPLTAAFGEMTLMLFSRLGCAGFASAPAGGDCFLRDRQGLNLVRVPALAFQSSPRSTELFPAKGVPGSLVSVTGTYGSGVRAVFMREEVLGSHSAAENATPSSFDAEIPLESAPGKVQVWVSESSAEALDGGTYVACTPLDFEAIGTIDAIDRLLSELETLLRDPSLSREAVRSLEAAIASLRKAKALLGDGLCKEALLEMVAAWDQVELAALPAATTAALGRATGQIVQYTVYAKLRAIEGALGSDDADVKEARAAFAAARLLLRQGRIKDALRGYLGSYEWVEKGIAKARRLRAAQAFVILSDAIGDMVKLGHHINDRRLTRPHSANLSPYLAAIHLVGGHGEMKGTAMGAMAQLRVPEAAALIKQAVAELKKAGPSARDLQEDACELLGALVARTADAIESNVGPFDPLVTRARRCLERFEKCCTTGDHTGATAALQEALGGGIAEATASHTHAQLFMAMDSDTTPCNPKVDIDPIPPVCVHPRLGTIDPNPVRISVHVQTDTPAAGTLNVTIKRSKGGASIRHLGPIPVAAPTPITVIWNGKDDANALVTFKGLANQDELIAEAQFTCISSEGETKSPPKQREFTIVRDGGLIVKPSKANKCESKPGHKVTQQFQAFRCQEGQGLVDVTPDCDWTLDNLKIGTIGINTGLFEGRDNAVGKGKVTAVHKESGDRGEAKINVTSEGGGIVDPRVDLCHHGTFDFDVVKGCDADGNSMAQDDTSYTWSLSDNAMGTITASGFFTANDIKGTVTVIAERTVTEEHYEAIVNISDIDTIDVVRAPREMCSDGDLRQFMVQVFCQGQPQAGVTVEFKAEEHTANGQVAPSGAVTLNPKQDITDAFGLAETDVSSAQPPVVSKEPGSTRLIATAQGVSASAAVTVAPVTVQFKDLPPFMCVDEVWTIKVELKCGEHPVVGQPQVTLTSNGGSVLFNGLPVLTAPAPGGVLNVSIKARRAGNAVITATSGAATANAVIPIHNVDLQIVSAPAVLCTGDSGTVVARVTCEGEMLLSPISLTLSANNDAISPQVQIVQTTGGEVTFTISGARASPSVNGTLLTLSGGGSTSFAALTVVGLFVSETPQYLQFGSRPGLKIVAEPPGMGPVSLSATSTGRGMVEFFDFGNPVGPVLEVSPPISESRISYRGSKTSLTKEDVTLTFGYGPCTHERKLTVGALVEWNVPGIRPLYDTTNGPSPGWDVIVSGQLLMEDRTPITGKKCHVSLDQPTANDWKLIGVAESIEGLPAIASNGSASTGSPQTTTNGQGFFYARLKLEPPPEREPRDFLRASYIGVVYEQYGDPFSGFGPVNGPPGPSTGIIPSLGGGNIEVPNETPLTRFGAEGLIKEIGFFGQYELVSGAAGNINLSQDSLLGKAIRAFLTSVLGKEKTQELYDLLSDFDSRESALVLASYVLGFTRGIETAGKDTWEFFGSLPETLVNVWKYIRDTIGEDLATILVPGLNPDNKGVERLKGDADAKAKAFYEGMLKAHEDFKKIIPVIKENPEAFGEAVQEEVFENTANKTFLVFFIETLYSKEERRNRDTVARAKGLATGGVVAGGFTAFMVATIKDPVMDVAVVGGAFLAFRGIVKVFKFLKGADPNLLRALAKSWAFVKRGLGTSLFVVKEAKNQPAVLKVFGNIMDGMHESKIVKVFDLPNNAKERTLIRDRYVRLFDHLRGLRGDNLGIELSGKVKNSYSEGFTRAINGLQETADVPGGRRNMPQATLLAMEGVMSGEGRAALVHPDFIEPGTKGLGRLLQTEVKEGVDIHEAFLGIDAATGKAKTGVKGIAPASLPRVLQRVGRFEDANGARNVPVTMKKFVEARKAAGDRGIKDDVGVEIVGKFLSHNAVAPPGADNLDKIKDVEKTFQILKEPKWYETKNVKGMFVFESEAGAVSLSSNDHFFSRMAGDNNKGSIMELFVVEQKIGVPSGRGEFVHMGRKVKLSDGSELDVDVFKRKSIAGLGTVDEGHEIKSATLDLDDSSRTQFTKIKNAILEDKVATYDLWLEEGMTPAMSTWMDQNILNVPDLRGKFFVRPNLGLLEK